MGFTHLTRRFQSLHSPCISEEHGEHYRRTTLLRTSLGNIKGNIGATFKETQSALLRYLFPMLPVFPLLYNRSMYHVPSVPDVTHGANGTCGTFAPSGTWYVNVILIKLAFAFVTFCESNAKILLAAELS